MVEEYTMTIAELARKIRARIDGGMALTLEDVMHGIEILDESKSRGSDSEVLYRIDDAYCTRMRRARSAA